MVLRDATHAFDREYTYAVPADLRDGLTVGSWVDVPFGPGNRSAQAYVIALEPDAISDYYIKPVSRLLHDRPVLLPDQLVLAGQMRSRYWCTYGDALRCMVPSAVSAVRDKYVQMVELCDPEEAARGLAEGEFERIGHRRAVELLLEYGTAPFHEVLNACQISRAVLRTLEKKQIVVLSQQETRRQLADETDYSLQPELPPNPGQKAAIASIRAALVDIPPERTGREFVLFGITGSGKTEVYLQTARQAVELGRGVIILVPEISLTPQMIGRIRSRFGQAVAVLHSRLTPAERYEQWQRILRQEVQVVVGARSAIFAPLRNPGLIIIDEEQESTYKSETHPRYHARDIARLRAQAHGAALVLGSATPAVETFHRAETGQATLLVLAERIGESGLPWTQIVDMRQELRDGNRSIFSRALRQSLQTAFASGRQAMLFINRRGFAGFMLCRDCGQVVKCKSCSVSLTTHLNSAATAGSSAETMLICHYCGKISKPPRTCPHCGSERIGRFGAGTQQVEQLFQTEFAPARAIRMDQDTTTGRGSHARLLAQFAAHEAQVLIGTQMIAKGHDFPNVTVVGILAADLMLGMSDFRAAERAFQLITQAAGRAGRGAAAGEVIIQAYNTDDFAIRAAAAQDYPAFYKQEIAYRRAMRYPPFGTIGLILLSGPEEKPVQEKIMHLYQVLAAQRNSEAAWQGIELMNPSRAPLFLLRGRYRWRLIITAPDASRLAAFLNVTLAHYEFKPLAVTIDIDPYNLM